MFYGWWVVSCTFTVLLIAYGIQFCFGTMLPAIVADTGWDRASLSLPYALYVFLYGFLSLVTGRLTDRFGPRGVIAGGAVLLGVGIGLFSRAQALWEAYLWLGVVAAMGMSAVFVPCNATLVRWFVRRRGLAVSLSATGASVGNLLLPPLAAGLTNWVGWRDAYLALAVVGGIAIAGISRFIVRDPERKGLLPDGDGEAEAAAQAAAPGPEYQLHEARRTRIFWLLTAIFTMTWLAIFTPFVHLPAGAIDRGLGAMAGAMLLSAIGAGGLVGRLGTGALSDRIGRSPALALTLTLQVAGFAVFASSGDLAILYLGALVFGVSYGGSTVLFPAIVADYFGRTAAGSIVGFIFGLAGATAAFGPVLAGFLYEASGSYTTAYWICAGCNACALGLMALLPRRS